jgi:regulator of protease activity HflC (stomatin/prohibitin superfamily)
MQVDRSKLAARSSPLLSPNHPEQRQVPADTASPHPICATIRTEHLVKQTPLEAHMELGFPVGTVAVVILIIYLLSSIKILAEYERGVIFRLGRLMGHAKGPGVIFVFAPIDRIVRVSLRQEALEVPPQDIITRDNVTLKVNAVIFLRVIDPNKAVVEVSNYVYQTSQFAQTTLRSVLGEQELDELLAHREKINLRLQSILDTHTAPWGVKVANVEVKQVHMPESMLRAMAKQAEAEREKRSKIIHAEGEFSAAQRLVDAAHLLATEPVSVQLRYLQTLTEIGVEKNTTVVFPVPVDFFSGIQKLLGNPPAPAKTGS